MAYQRPKREDAVKSAPEYLPIHIGIGSVDDSFESLKTMCNDKSIELMKSLDLNVGETMKVVFWTEDIPELIGISQFTKDKNGMVSFNLDFSERTV